MVKKTRKNPRERNPRERNPRERNPIRDTDFYNYVNKDWNKHFHIPPVQTRVTQAYFVKNTIDHELAKIIHHEEKIPDTIFHRLANSWKTAEKDHIPRGLSPLIQLMMSLKTPSDISARIGWMCGNGIDAPLQIYIQGDPRNHAKCRVFIEEGMPRIGIPEYWEGTFYTPTRQAYEEYCSALANAVGMPTIKNGMYAEKELAHLYPRVQERVNKKKRRRNILSWDELRQKYTQFDWKRLFMNFGIPSSMIPKLTYNITSHHFLFHFQHRLKSWSPVRWQEWFALNVVQWLSQSSPHGPLRSAWFGFYRRFMQGTIQDKTQIELRQAIPRMLLFHSLGKLWVQKYCPDSLKKEIGIMIVSIQEAAENLLKHTPWMSHNTKKEAIHKLHRMILQYCYPDEWDVREEECGLQGNYVENLLELGRANTERNIESLKKGCGAQTRTWDRPAYEVNAFYYPEQNRMVIPGGILRTPFYDEKKSIAWNYGGIGSTIGHELCHAFDSDGRRYDYRGDLQDWWTEHDDREYRKRARKVVELFESEQYRGMNVDGELTLVENIADIGGMEFALSALKTRLGIKLTKQDIQEFFISYAVNWRSKDRIRKAEQLLDTDPHAPPRLRVNHVVRQIDDWYSAFDIKPDYEGFIPQEKRIRFFS
jgi:predicted metalloendopeptidase